MRITAPRINPDFTADHAARIRPELTEIPPCQRCGAVPVGGYSRYDDGSVTCIDRSRCLSLTPSEN